MAAIDRYIDAPKNSLDDLIAEFEGRIDSLAEEISVKSQKLDEKYEEIEQLKSSHQEELDKLQEQLDELLSENQELKDKLSEYENND
jgi:predicted  nucleic acid-binding Zn-ribbon protein